MFSPLLFSLFLSFRITSLSWRTGASLFFAILGGHGFVDGDDIRHLRSDRHREDVLRPGDRIRRSELFGYVTKMDMSPMRSFLIMGVWGIVGARW